MAFTNEIYHDDTSSEAPSTSSSVEVIRMDELASELDAITVSQPTAKPQPQTTGSHVASAPTVGERLMNFASAAAQFFRRPVAEPVAQRPTVQLARFKTSRAGITYMRLPEGRELNSLRYTVDVLQRFSESYVHNRWSYQVLGEVLVTYQCHTIFVHMFPPSGHLIDEEMTVLAVTAYYREVLTVIEEILSDSCGGVTATLKSLLLSTGQRKIFEKEGAMPTPFMSLAPELAVICLQQTMLKLTFNDSTTGIKFHRIFNGPANKARMATGVIGGQRIPFCHFESTLPERRLRKALLTYCVELNAREPGTRHVTNGMHIFKKIECIYGAESAKVPIPRGSELGLLRAAVFTLHKYAHMHVQRRCNVMMRNLPQHFDIPAIDRLARRVLALSTYSLENTEDCRAAFGFDEPTLRAIERVDRSSSAAPQLIRVALAARPAAREFMEVFRLFTSRKAQAGLQSGRPKNVGEGANDFPHEMLRELGTFVHCDLTPPELALHRRLREICRAQNAAGDGRFHYFCRDAALMQVLGRGQ